MCAVKHCAISLQVWVNLGSTHLARGELEDAVRMYSAALSKFRGHKDAKLLLYLARAQYTQGHITTAKRTLLKALHSVPTDVTMLFNAALCMQQYASKARAAALLRWQARASAHLAA